MTVLQIVNRVLRRLREDTVSSLVQTDYSTMLADMLYDVHLECIEAYDWSSMDNTIDVPVDASQRVLDLSRTEASGGDLSDTSTPTKVDSLLRFDREGRPLAWVFDSSSDTEGDRLTYVDESSMQRLYQVDRDHEADDPCYFSLRANPDRGGLEMSIWPVPTSAKHIRVRVWTPEDEIDTNTDGGRSLLVPDRPLVLGLLMMALNERGEEMGEPGNLAERRYYAALGAAIEGDSKRREQANEYEARRD